MQQLNGQPSFPWEIEWSLTWACNTNCFFCSTGNYSRKDYAKNINHICSEIINSKPLMVTLSGGEPTVHPKFEEICRNFAEASIPVNLTTNGISLDKISKDVLSSLNWIRVSVHAATFLVAEAVMGVGYPLDRVLNNLKLLIEVNDRASVFYLLNDKNSAEEQLQKYLELLANIGVKKIEFGAIKMLGWATEQALLDRKILEKRIAFIHSCAARLGLTVTTPDVSNSKHKCTVRQTSAAIFPDSTVRSCSFDDEIWGNLDLESLQDIWSKRAKLDEYCDRCRPGGYFLDHKDLTSNRTIVLHSINS